MQLWRTGACELLYDSKEDDEAFVSCEMYTGIDITYTGIYYLFKCRRCYKTLRQGNLQLARTQLSLYGKNTEFGMVKFHCKRHVEVVLLSLMKICMKN